MRGRRRGWRRRRRGGGYDGTRARQREGRGCALGTEKLRGTAETAATAFSRTGGATASTLCPSLVVAKLA